jgi:hypothetical protein
MAGFDRFTIFLVRLEARVHSRRRSISLQLPTIPTVAAYTVEKMRYAGNPAYKNVHGPTA